MAIKINPFAASAAALVASHAVSDAIWRKHFPDLPLDRPELRTILIKLHRHALEGEPLNRGDAELMIINEFGVSDGAASQWLKILERELGMIIRRPGRRGQEIHLVPSLGSKAHLHEVGLEYLACGRLVFQVLSDAVKIASADFSKMDWAEEIREVMRCEIVDYPTDRGIKESKKAKRGGENGG